ncbi:hypothetical protein BDZ91DRAFT_779398 [Kalaharituber pfeilii]|nr:hypothetical protein BDZ91DRAFT_779398 [Kalaharituber pfeilii]
MAAAQVQNAGQGAHDTAQQPGSDSSMPKGQSEGESNDMDLVIYCCICFQPLSSSPPRQQGDEESPFWLTSCGHIACTEHIFADGVPKDAMRKKHACPFCHSTDISTMSIGAGQTPAYLQDYFRPGNELLSDFCGAMKACLNRHWLETKIIVQSNGLKFQFQYNNLLRIAAHFKKKAQEYQERTEKHRAVLRGVRDELAMATALKRENDILKQEIETLRGLLKKQPNQGVQEAQDFITTSHQSQGSNISQKRKSPYESEALDKEDSISREKRFRNEINARQAMPPPRDRIQHVARQGQLGLSSGRSPSENPEKSYQLQQEQRQSVDKYRNRDQRQLEQHQACTKNIQSNLNFSPQYGQESGLNIISTHSGYGSRPIYTADSTRSLYLSMAPLESVIPPRSSHQGLNLQTLQRPSLSRNIDTPFKPPPAIHDPQHISPFMSRILARSPSMRLSAAENHQSNRSSSPAERLSLPPKPITRNPPRGVVQDNHLSPFYREDISSGGTLSSRTLAGNSRNGMDDKTSSNSGYYRSQTGMAEYGNRSMPGLRGIGMDREGLFRREPVSSDFRLTEYLMSRELAHARTLSWITAGRS